MISKALFRPAHRTSAICRRIVASPQYRSSSTQASSPHTNFYKTFGRPIAKVLLVAVFTYQVTYWAWVKLEQDEIKAERQADISRLESEIRGAQSPGKTGP